MSGRDRGRSRTSAASSSDDEDFTFIVKGIPRHWGWQEFKDQVRRYAPQVKTAQVDHEGRLNGGLGTITVTGERKVWKAYEAFSNRVIDGRRLKAAIKNSNCEVIAGQHLYESLTISTRAPHAAQISVPTPPLLTASSPVTATSSIHYANHDMQTRGLNGSSGLGMMGAGYNLPTTLPNIAISQKVPLSPSNYRTSSAVTSNTHGMIPQPVNAISSTRQVYNSSAAESQAYSYAAGVTSPNSATQTTATAANNSSSGHVPSPTQREVYIQNVNYQADWRDLKDHLLTSPGSHVDHCTIFVDPDGHSKGRAIATFRTPGQAQRAISDLDGKKFLGKRLKITFNKTNSPTDPDEERSSPAAPTERNESRRGPLVVDGTPLFVGRGRH